LSLVILDRIRLDEGRNRVSERGRRVDITVTPDTVLVWDTSSLSHAFESLSHTIMSAYMSLRERGHVPSWEDFKASVLRRLGSGAVSRLLLLYCDKAECVAPNSVWEELGRSAGFSDMLKALDSPRMLEKDYIQRSKRSDATGFSEAFEIKLKKEPVNSRIEPVLREVEEEASLLGLNLSRADLEGVAVALYYTRLGVNTYLVTSDKNQAVLAQRLGVKVIFTMPKQFNPMRAVDSVLNDENG